MARRLRFGICSPRSTLVERWRYVEALDFDSAPYEPASFLR